VQAGLVADLDRRIHQIDAAIETATQRGRTNAAMQLAADQRRSRAELATHRDQASKALADFKIEKAKVDGDRKVAEAEPGAGALSGDAAWRRRSGRAPVVHPGRGAAARPGRAAAAARRGGPTMRGWRGNTALPRRPIGFILPYF
jgi:hypothetical protein